jgi:HEPN domain-containing protein
MNPLTLEWVDKAEGDYATALRELRARKQPNYDAACFHAQQCVEKYLKAYLQE